MASRTRTAAAAISPASWPSTMPFRKRSRPADRRSATMPGPMASWAISPPSSTFTGARANPAAGATAERSGGSPREGAAPGTARAASVSVIPRRPCVLIMSEHWRTTRPSESLGCVEPLPRVVLRRMRAGRGDWSTERPEEAVTLEKEEPEQESGQPAHQPRLDRSGGGRRAAASRACALPSALTLPASRVSVDDSSLRR